jgi:hypothetical protein
MSRSYRKVLKYKEVEADKSFRARNLVCIRREMKNGDFGEVVFPAYKECVRVLGRNRPPVSKKKIRDGYFLEIRNILNGYIYHSGIYYYHDDEPDEEFIEQCNRIKGLIPDNGRKYEFEWLNSKSVREAIKTWTGEPFEVLKALTDSGLIEEAVRKEFKLSTGK